MFERIRVFLLRLVPSPVLRLVEGFWATPLALSVFGVGLAVALQAVPPGAVGQTWVRYFEGVDVDGTKSALSVIAGSMVSLVTLVFSLTFVALSITAQQLSPRILDFVMRERSAQTLLGVALATLLYCAITLSMGDVKGAWRLGMAMPPALLLAAATLVLVVIFAHGMTRVMRAEEMVARLGNHFIADVRRVLQPPADCTAVGDEAADFEREFDEAETLRARCAGYVGTIDYSGLIALAAEKNLKLALDVRESDFLLPGVCVARVLGLHPGEEARDKVGQAVERALNLSDRREASDTAGYEAAALCEAALRALSPGINDPATAISCVNRLFEGLAVLAAEDPPPRLLAGEDGVARVIRPAREVPEFIASSVVPVVAAARGEARTLDRVAALARQLDRIAAAGDGHARARVAIARLLEMIEAEQARHAA